MAELAANGLKFHVQVLQRPPEVGVDRPKVVMVHGLSVDMSSFYITIAGGVAVDSDVYLYDLRGHGRSEVPPRGYTVADHLADLVALLDAWEITEPVNLFGNSFGGIVALFFAHYYPERVASLFLIEPIASGEGWGRRLVDSILEFNNDAVAKAELVNKHRANQRWARKVRVLFRTTTMLDDLAASEDLPADWLADLGCPVFSIYGSDSDVREEAIERDRLIPGCEHFIVSGCTHRIIAEANVVVRNQATDWMRRNGRALARGHG